MGGSSTSFDASDGGALCDDMNPRTKLTPRRKGELEPRPAVGLRVILRGIVLLYFSWICETKNMRWSTENGVELMENRP